MPRPTKLLPGQEVTVAAFNAEIDRTRKQLAGAVGSTMQGGTTGGALAAMRELQPRWGRLTDTGPERSPDYYQWEEVYPDKDNKWTAKTGDADTQLAPHDSQIFTDVYNDEWLINPAVEVNGRKPPLGTVVRLIPTEHFVEEEKGLEDDRDDYWFHRHWLFVWDETLRPFVITGPIIPAGGAGIGTPAEKDLLVGAEWLDDPGETVTLYPVHRRGWPAGDEFLSHGVMRGPGNYFRGTYGWARYEPMATIEDFTADGELIWRGEWQIVTVYADLIQQARIYDADIPAGERGKAQLWWIDKDVSHTSNFATDPVIENSHFQIELFNSTDREMKIGERAEVYFSRAHYVWQPVAPAERHRNFARVETGWTNTLAGAAASETVSVKTCDYDDSTTAAGDAFNVETIPRENMDTAIFSAGTAKSGKGYIIEWGLAPNGDKVIVSDIWDDPIGTVKWESVNTANIRDGWRLCDGTGTAPDLRRMFIMSVDPADGAGDGSENAIGDSGGFSKHGATENNHDKHTDDAVVDCVGDHDDHTGADVAGALDDHAVHNHPLIQASEVSEDAGAVLLVDMPGNTDNNAAAQAHSGAGAVTPLSHSEHVVEAGDHDLDHTDSDNRPRFYVLAAIQRYAS